jgi:hypothetical protein
LAAGVDSLYLSARGTFREGLEATLVSGKAEAENTREPAVLTFGESGSMFLVRPHGWRRYPFWLTSANVELFVGASDPAPAVHVMLRASFIHRVGIEAATAEVEELLNAHVFAGSCVLTVGRADIFADVQGWAPRRTDLDRFICRAIHRRSFELPAIVYSQGRNFSGFTFGKGDIVARIYNKSLEMRGTGETWPQLLWQDHDSSQPVWRVEFQFRSRALRSFGISSVYALLVGRQDLWDYATQWLSLRQRGGHKNRSRWAEARAWSDLRRAQIGSPACGLIREHIERIDELRLLRGFVGYTSSLAALRNTDDLDEALRLLTPSAHGYLAERGLRFADVVRRKRKKNSRLMERDGAFQHRLAS